MVVVGLHPDGTDRHCIDVPDSSSHSEGGLSGREGDSRMSIEEHKKKHEELHKALDELAADFLGHNENKRLHNTTLMELIEWSHSQTLNPCSFSNI